MFDLKAHLFARSAIGFELVGDHDARRSCRLLEKLAHEPLRGSSISPALDENVENEAILIDSAPKPVLPASDRDHNLASRAEELHLRALLEPYVTLSSHTAPDVRSSTCTKRQCAKRFGFARRTRASQSLARLGLRRRRLNLSQAQRTRAASTRLSVQFNADL